MDPHKDMPPEPGRVADPDPISGSGLSVVFAVNMTKRPKKVLFKSFKKLCPRLQLFNEKITLMASASQDAERCYGSGSTILVTGQP